MNAKQKLQDYKFIRRFWGSLCCITNFHFRNDSGWFSYTKIGKHFVKLNNIPRKYVEVFVQRSFEILKLWLLLVFQLSLVHPYCALPRRAFFFFSFPIPIKVIETLDHDYKYILFFMSADTGMYTDRKYKTKYIRCHFSVNLTCRRDTCAEEFHM